MININGTLLNFNEAYIQTENRGLLYGDAVFETLKVSEKKIFFWEDHYFRLMASLRILRMDIPLSFTMEFLENEILKTIYNQAEQHQDYRVKLFVSRKAGGKYTPYTNEVEYFIECEPLENSFYMINESDYEIELFKDHFISSGLLSTLKTNTKTIQVLGSIFAKENGYQNCLILNENKHVVEALNGNVFLVKGNSIITPSLEQGCLRGILRKQLKTICEQLPDYTFEERFVSPFELLKVDELFITNVIKGMQPVTVYRKKIYKTEVTKLLLQRLNALIRLN